MSNSLQKILKKEYNRLKGMFERLADTGKKQNKPSLILQPVRNQPQPGK
jgi:hypothetical protein